MKRKFEVIITEVYELEVDDTVLQSIDDEWREHFYRTVKTDEDKACFIAGNMRATHPISSIDGLADRNNDEAFCSLDDVESYAKEIKP